MAWAETLRYEVIDSSELTPQQHVDISKLQRQSLAQDYPDRTKAERAFVVAESEHTRSDPNLAVGGPLISVGQSYARAAHALAFDQHNNLVSSLPFADNVSSGHHKVVPGFISGILGQVEREIKLHSEQLIERRWLWLGTYALRADARQHHAQANESDALVLHGHLAAILPTRDERQPAAAYPNEEEHVLAQSLCKSGFRLNVGKEQLIPMFGESTPVVLQTRWTAPSLTAIRETIMSYDGGQNLLDTHAPKDY